MRKELKGMAQLYSGMGDGEEDDSGGIKEE